MIWSTARKVAKLSPIGRIRLRTRSIAPSHGLVSVTAVFIFRLNCVTDHSGDSFHTTMGASASPISSVVQTQLARLSRNRTLAYCSTKIPNQNSR